MMTYLTRRKRSNGVLRSKRTIPIRAPTPTLSASPSTSLPRSVASVLACRVHVPTQAMPGILTAGVATVRFSPSSSTTSSMKISVQLKHSESRLLTILASRAPLQRPLRSRVLMRAAPSRAIARRSFSPQANTTSVPFSPRQVCPASRMHSTEWS